MDDILNACRSFDLTDGKPTTPIDIFAIGFEEMVELNAGNIVSARYVTSLRANQKIYCGWVEGDNNTPKHFLLTVH